MISSLVTYSILMRKHKQVCPKEYRKLFRIIYLFVTSKDKKRYKTYPIYKGTS